MDSNWTATAIYLEIVGLIPVWDAFSIESLLEASL